jgi:hypothetical protein
MIAMKRTFLTLAAGAAFAWAHAQTPGGSEYVIQGIYNPTLADAQKIDLRPEPIDTVLPTIPVRYDLLPVVAETPARVDSLAAARLTVEAKQQRLYKAFAKAGFGLYTTPLAEFYFDQARSRKNGYGVHLKHFSSQGGLKDAGPSDYSFNAAEAYYRHFLPEHEASGALLFDRRAVSYYGYQATDSVRRLIDFMPGKAVDAQRQVYNDLGFKARLRSLYRDSTRIAHDIALEAHAFSNLGGSRETNLRVGAEVGKQEGAEYYSGTLLIDNNAYKGDIADTLGTFRQNGTLLGLSPAVRTVGQRYFVKAGAGMYVDALGSTTFHFFPQVYAHYALFDNILVPYVGLDGNRRRNSFRSLSRENPWLTRGPALRNTSTLFDVYAGLRGSFMNNLGFDVRVSRSTLEDMPLFVNVPTAPFGDRMSVVYDEVDILNVSGQLTYSRNEDLRLSARIDLYSYAIKLQDQPWNLPPYKLTFAARYSLRDKLLLKAEALFLGKRPAYRAPDLSGSNGGVVTANKVDLDGFLDLYLGVEYRYTKRLSLFFDFSNLTASKYERWYNYGVQRGLIMGGATYSF